MPEPTGSVSVFQMVASGVSFVKGLFTRRPPPIIDAKGGDLHIRAGDGNEHGKGGDIHVGPGSYRAGDGGDVIYTQQAQNNGQYSKKK